LKTKKKEINIKSEEKLQQVEEEINTFKIEAMKSINDIASQVAKDLVKKVSKAETNEASARAIVEEISKKLTRGLN
jgi:F0F1-type ATP synthase membrane subunit b/b'